jgi:hypothetical protein
MAGNKTVPTRQSVATFLAGIADRTRRSDAETLLKLMRKASGEKPVMWGPSIVGFGTHHYVYETGREGDMPLIGFSPRKSALVIYGAIGSGAAGAQLERLGRYTMGKGCLYIKKLADVDCGVLEQILAKAVRAKGKLSRPSR